MKKKSIVALTAAAAISVGLGAGSYAWFTSTATSAGNEFKTGTLNITQDVSAWSDVGAGTVDVTNMQPGDQKMLSFTIGKGTSSLDLKYKIELVAVTQDANIPNLLDVAKFELRVNGTSMQSQKTISQMNDFLTTYIKTLDASNVSDSYQLIVTLPEDTGNGYQGGTGSFTIKTRATQTDIKADFNF